MNTSAKTIKLSEENIDIDLHDLGLGNDFLDMTSEAQATKGKIDKLSFIKIKNFCVSKDTMKKGKREPTEWGKFFANPEYIKNSYDATIKRQVTQFKNGQSI